MKMGQKTQYYGYVFPKDYFVESTSSRFSYVILRPNLLLLQREGISLIQGIRIIKSLEYKEL